MNDDTANIDMSNSLADLAARIRDEHEACAFSLKRGFEHAVAAGRLLIEAKAQLKHGRWREWLRDNCPATERTAQAYMQVARAFNALGDDAKSATVADLSFREALQNLSVAGDLAEAAEGRDHADAWRRAIKQAQRQDERAAYSLETPSGLLPSPNGRKIRVARNAAERRWMLAIGPTISRAELKEKAQAARATAAVQALARQKCELIDKAAALEAESKRLQQEAQALERNITEAIAEGVGPVEPFTATHDFQADEVTDAELAALPQADLVNCLLLARGANGEDLAETDRGFWGDMTLPWTQLTSAISGPGRKGWTRMGSPEWLDELFPGWNKAGA
jgi:hypothetical protein